MGPEREKEASSSWHAVTSLIIEAPVTTRRR